jgi:hypothetical protein
MWVGYEVQEMLWEGSGMSEPKSMHARVHIVVGGHGDERGDWVATLCGLTVPMKDQSMSWVFTDEGAHCKTCLKKWAERSSR